MTLKDYARELAQTLSCNCDLDNWEPERNTRHSEVCRIHIRAVQWHRAECLKAQS